MDIQTHIAMVYPQLRWVRGPQILVKRYIHQDKVICFLYERDAHVFTSRRTHVFTIVIYVDILNIHISDAICDALWAL